MRIKVNKIFLAGVESVTPEKLIPSIMKRTEDTLLIGDNSYSLSRYNHVYILAAGKAAAAMAREVERIIGDRITKGVVITKLEQDESVKSSNKTRYNTNSTYVNMVQSLRLNPRISLFEAGHPIPDAEGVKGTREMVQIARQANENDLVICLLSGGASALMADYPEGSTLQDLRDTNELLVKCGADIEEINSVRKHLSGVKGGQLAKLIHPATTVSLILSDVVGDRLDVIASGPTVGDGSTFADAWRVVQKYSLQNKLPSSILAHLKRGLADEVMETPKPNDSIFNGVKNIIVGNNSRALQNASKKAKEMCFKTFVVTDKLMGDYTDVANFILKTIDRHKQLTTRESLCLLFGGEPTVKVTGNGLGGRNQQLALYLLTKIDSLKNTTILCAGTDGTDGPTDAAGAVIDSESAVIASQKGVCAEAFLRNADSYHFFQKAGGHIFTGNTGTNVMDIIAVIVSHKQISLPSRGLFKNSSLA